MSDTSLIMALAKVIIAAAWADGQVTNEEINSLKDLLFRLPDMTARDWASLDIYIDSPVDEAEAARLIEDLKRNISSSRDKELVVNSLDELLAADGNVSEEERQLLQEIKDELEHADDRIIGSLGRLLRGPVQRRSQAVNAPNRENYLNDFIENRIYYHVRRRIIESEANVDLPEEELRKLSLASGLLARVAFVDRDIKQEEKDGMSRGLQKGWNIPPQAAGLVVDVATNEIGKDIDYYRLSREFFESTTEAERLAFTEALFAIAAEDGFVTNEEIEEIRTIGLVLKLTHKQFIDAKLTVPREKRAN